MNITEVSIMHHVGIILVFLWVLSLLNRCHPLTYFLSLIYLYLVHERYVMRMRKKLQYEERKQAHQKRLLSDSETVRWLNHAVEKIWPVCMEPIASRKILLPIIPWFLEKYKPWTAKQVLVQHMYLGRNPPLFTEIRVLQHGPGDDHLVLELGMNFCTADDMSAILAVKLRKRLGFGMWTKLHITGMHVEGKVLVGVKFLRDWPFIGRLRVCFAEPPYFQMTVKPIFTHGFDVTEVPGIAGWLDKLLSIAFEQTLVQPNMLVVDVEKFVSPQQENWFHVDEKEAVAFVRVEVVAASDMKPSDLNGLADPYVKGQLGPYRFRTKIQKKTLSPKWLEEFKIPIRTWESPNVLAIEVRDKDHFVDDTLGIFSTYDAMNSNRDCTINIDELRDGARHDMWLPLQNINVGRLHLAITVHEDIAKCDDNLYDGETWNKEEMPDAFSSENSNRTSAPSASSEKSPKVADILERINIEGQEKIGIWVHHPGTEVLQTWEPRKGKTRRLDNNFQGVPGDSFSSTNIASSGPLHDDSSGGDENNDGKKRMSKVQQGLHKIGSAFHRNKKHEDYSSNMVVDAPSPYANIKSVNHREIGVKLIVEDVHPMPTPGKYSKEANFSPGGIGSESPGKENKRGMRKSIIRQAHGIKNALSRKGLRISQGDSSQTTDKEIGLKSDSSDDESISSPQVDKIPIASNPMLSSNSDGSDKTKVISPKTALSEVAMITEGPGKEVDGVGLERTANNNS